MTKTICKNIYRNYVKRNSVSDIETNNDTSSEVKKNNKDKNRVKKMNQEDLSILENALNISDTRKVVKKERGLIERTESSKIILTEDNRQVLTD